MPNTIPQRQNEPRELEHLKAQRYGYSRTKRLMALQSALAVPVPLAWSLAVAIRPSLAVFAAFGSISASLVDALILTPLQQSCRRRAAGIQEAFDCEVLGLPWNDVQADSRPDNELLTRWARRHERSGQSRRTLGSWYPAGVGELPLHLGRLVCQRANVWWDGELREAYMRWLLGVLIGLLFVMFFVGLIGGLTLEKFVLAILAPISPAVFWGAREWRGQKDAVERAKRLRRYLEALWRRALGREVNEETCAQESRALQDAILQHRYRAPLVFDWIYRVLRPHYGEEMRKGAEALIAEAKGKGGMGRRA